jgi:hypothetical protein
LFCFLKINYVSNIKFKKPLFQKAVAKPRILFNRRFIIFFHLFNLSTGNNLIFYEILHKPTKFRKFNILRAPYKNKIAQNSYAFYKYQYSLFFKTKQKVLFNKIFFFYIIQLFKRGLLGTNINFVKSINISKYYQLQI